jgi:Xaa-Pro aminopeptidase
MTARIDRLRASLEEPLLVTNPTNIYYLFGFQSSNAALLVEPDGVRLFSDFRYAEAARAVDGVRFEETRRALLWDLAERLSGPIGFEADYVSYSSWETLGSGRVEPVPRRNLVERLRAVKDARELETIRRACEITDRMFERSRGRSSSSSTRRVPTTSRSRASWRPGRTPLVRTPVRPTARSRQERRW